MYRLQEQCVRITGCLKTSAKSVELCKADRYSLGSVRRNTLKCVERKSSKQCLKPFYLLVTFIVMLLHTFFLFLFFENLLLKHRHTLGGLYIDTAKHRVFVLISAFAKLRKATISFVMSVCQSVSTHGKTRLPLHGF